MTRGRAEVKQVFSYFLSIMKDTNSHFVYAILMVIETQERIFFNVSYMGDAFNTRF